MIKSVFFSKQEEVPEGPECSDKTHSHLSTSITKVIILHQCFYLMLILSYRNIVSMNAIVLTGVL